ncbi:pyridoxamine 5'-phosphate oxidase family protein [Geobacter sp.]|uniref:pyridoxamine 5'-phosphate oxidase family protein n=1 Tax=Geobacter sp. TaxID=46610 RepID=UPI00260948A2|nr:pyridoxamine 5'-phosphate oxidase family protein [Geobacter sp.]
MRKANKRITEFSLLVELLHRCHVGRLGTVGRDGWPMVKPLNFAWHEGRIYFHCAPEGEKLDEIRHEERVCFEADLPIAYVKGAPDNPCRAEYLYRSVIIRGRARLVTEAAEKVLALDALMKKYEPGASFAPYREEKLAITGIVRIDVEEMVGKEELGKGEIREKTLALLAGGGPLPVVLE